jgi:phage terminase small subunit
MNWDEIKKEYESSNITLAALSEKYDIKLGTLKSRKSREGWSKDATKKDATKVKKVATQKEKVAFEKQKELLTPKQEIFIREYMIDLNATQAAIRAGYSVKTARQIASENMAKPDILARIEKLKAERAEKLKIDAEWVLNRLVQISDRCIQTEPVLAFDYESKSMVETGEYQFDSTGANKATELIGKHLGMFKDKVEITKETVINVTLGDDDD